MFSSSFQRSSRKGWAGGDVARLLLQFCSDCHLLQYQTTLYNGNGTRIYTNIYRWCIYCSHSYTHTPAKGLDTYCSHVNFHASHFVPSGSTHCNSYLTFVRFVWRGSHSLALYNGYRDNEKDKYYDKQCSRC